MRDGQMGASPLGSSAGSGGVWGRDLTPVKNQAIGKCDGISRGKPGRVRFGPWLEKGDQTRRGCSAKQWPFRIFLKRFRRGPY